jgi:hypothetical protein
MIARRSLLRTLVSLCAVVGGLLFVWSAPALAQRMHEFGKSFGGEGAGEGQLSHPGALAVNEATGDVYVIDRGNGRVEIFNSTGAYLGQFNGSESPTGAFSWPEHIRNVSAQGGIAVDNSNDPLDPSAGDVYVVDMGHLVIDKFTASGTYIGQIKGRSPGLPFSEENGNELAGVAVDSIGVLWVLPANSGHSNVLYRFNDVLANEFVGELEPKFEFGEQSFNLGDIGFAFDSEGNVYLGHHTSESDFTVPAKFNSAGTMLAREVDGEETTGLAVDRSDNDVYVDNETAVGAFGSSGSPIERFGSAQLHDSEGVAVNSSTGTVYVSDATSNTVDVFTSFVVPDVSTGFASSLAETSATVTGVMNPDGLPVTSCVFEYGTTTSYGEEEKCSASPGSGSGPVAVSASLSGLTPLTRYHFRLKVANANGSDEGQDHSFVTPVPVAVTEQEVADVSSSGARFSALVDPGAADTKFRFEYGTSVSYGQSVPAPEGDLGEGTAAAPVAISVQNLLPLTTYHVRIAATNLFGTVYGPDQTFTTQPAGGAFALPDGRAWEMVSPPNKHGAGVEALKEGRVEAAENGGAITYTANAPVGEGTAGNPTPSEGFQVLSRRAPGGWSSESLATPHSSAVGINGIREYQAFSSDLSQGLVEPELDTPLSPEATERTIYLRNNDTGSYLPLVTPANVPPGTRFGPLHPEGSGQDDGVDALIGTPDLSHVLLASPQALTSDAPTLPRAQGRESNIYEWAGGRLTLVSILPGGEPDEEGADVGERSVSVRHALSNDGSRVFWQPSHESEGRLPLYMRDIVTGQTVKVDATAPGVPAAPRFTARFQIASADGSKVFFLENAPLTADSNLPRLEEGAANNDLYVYDAEAKTLTDLSADHNGSEPAGVKRTVLGAAEDGSVVYFVATGALANGAKAGEDNLYVESESGATWSPPKLIAVLSPEDSPSWGGTRGSQEEGDPNKMTAAVSPDGHFLAFMSERSLTGYDNRDVQSGGRDVEVFLYDELSGALTCVSCNPTGTRPTGFPDVNRAQLAGAGQWIGVGLAATIPTWESVKSEAFATYQPRYLSDEGRLFFNSFDSLVAQDTNGTADVYEYEPEGVGSCGPESSSGADVFKPTRVFEVEGIKGQEKVGCVGLISSGTSAQESALLDVSGKGPGGEESEDVFFLTSARLASQDVDTGADVYDAHICSRAAPCVSVPVSPPACSSGDSCKPAPSPQPTVFGAPPSALFSGTGNIVGAPVSRGIASKSLTRAQKLARALRGCATQDKPKGRRSTRKRAACERQARKRYGMLRSREASATRKGVR